MVTPAQNQMSRSDKRLLAVSGILLLAWNVISWRFPFFWDTVSHARIATWYLETGFSQLTIPAGMDAGHPPFFNVYLAGAWAVFGRSLEVSHLAMLPLLALVLVQFHRLTMRWLDARGRVWAMLLLFCEPTFLAQAGMVTADIALVASYLLALNAMLDGRRWMLGIALVGLAAMSFRGILMVGTLFVTDLMLNWGARKWRPMHVWRVLRPYVPVAILTLVWLWVHHAAVGWWITTPEENYGGQRQAVGIMGMARNLGLTGWRVMDFGRVFLWVFIVVAAVGVGWRRLFTDSALRRNLVVLAVPLGMLTLLFIPFSNPIGHRYYLVCYLLAVVFAVGLAGMGEKGMHGQTGPDGSRKPWRTKFKVALAVVALGMATGHLWIYPRGIAQGWDGSLAHLPVFKLQAQAIDFLTGQKLSPKEVCADFPFLHPPHDTWLRPVTGGDSTWFQNYLEVEDCEWAVVSNVNNGFTDAHLAAFENPALWELMEEFRSWQLYIRIYHRK